MNEMEYFFSSYRISFYGSYVIMLATMSITLIKVCTTASEFIMCWGGVGTEGHGAKKNRKLSLLSKVFFFFKYHSTWYKAILTN